MAIKGGPGTDSWRSQHYQNIKKTENKIRDGVGDQEQPHLLNNRFLYQFVSTFPENLVNIRLSVESSPRLPHPPPKKEKT